MAVERSTRTARREETRRLLLEAAGTLFAERGYHATSVPDIVRAAGVGHGTFYEYFSSRHQILLALTESAASGSRRPRLQSDSLPERIRAEISWYFGDVVEHLQLTKVWREAATFDPEIAAAGRAERARRVERVRRGIEAAGPAPGIDPAIAAAALTAMLEAFADRWFVEGDGPGTSAADIVTASETLATMWLATLGLEPPAQPVRSSTPPR